MLGLGVYCYMHGSFCLAHVSDVTGTINLNDKLRDAVIASCMWAHHAADAACHHVAEAACHYVADAASIDLLFRRCFSNLHEAKS